MLNKKGSDEHAHEKLVALTRYLIEQSVGRDAPVQFARLINMIYLCDWKNNLVNDESITGCRWTLTHHGPRIQDFFTHIPDQGGVLKTRLSLDYFGGERIALCLSMTQGDCFHTLSDAEKNVAAFVLNGQWEKSYKHLLDLVYSTFPAISYSVGDYLDLRSISRAYKNVFDVGDATLSNLTTAMDHREFECRNQ